MIVGRLDESEKYGVLSVGIMKALEYLIESDFTETPAGKYSVVGDDVFALVQRYEVKPADKGLFEAHNNYIDIQYVVSGSELIGYAPKANQEVIHEYDAEGDYALFKGEASFVKLDEGMFAICFPDDLHMPGIGEDTSKVQKIVMKVKV